MREEKDQTIACNICREIIPLGTASVGMTSEEMGVYFDVLPRIEGHWEVDLCPPCLQKAIDTAKIEIYASDAAWEKFGRPRQK